MTDLVQTVSNIVGILMALVGVLGSASSSTARCST